MGTFSSLNSDLKFHSSYLGGSKGITIDRGLLTKSSKGGSGNRATSRTTTDNGKHSHRSTGHRGEEIAEIVRIVNTKPNFTPFSGIIHKLEKQISLRAKLQASTKLTISNSQFQTFEILPRQQTEEQEIHRSEVPKKADFQSPSKDSAIRELSPSSPNLAVSEVVTSPVTARQLASPRDARVENLLNDMENLTHIFEMKRQRFVKEQIGHFVANLHKVCQRRLNSYFTKLTQELSHQPLEAISKKKVKPNYATVIKYLKLKLPEAIESSEKCITKAILRQAFSSLKEEGITKILHQNNTIRLKRGVIKRLALNVKSEKQARLEDKLTQFFLRLDTYLIILKFSAFDAITNF